MKRLLIALGALAVILIGVGALLYTPDTDPVKMQAKYGGDLAHFAEGPDGMRVHYRDQGAREGTPVIFIHGSSAQLQTWAPVISRLEDKTYRLISYDQPGHGLTGPHPDDDYSFAGMAQALDAVMAATGVQKTVLVGNSMGGWVAWRYAMAHPNRVSALVLIDAAGAPLPPDAQPELPLGFKLQESAIGRFLGQHFTPRGLVEKSLKQTVYDPSIVTDEMIDRYWELVRYPGNRRATALRALADREPEKAARMPEITVPTLILWGEEDKLIPVAAAHEFDNRLPNSFLLVYKNVGHIPMEEVPANVAEDIDAFLQEALVYGR